MADKTRSRPSTAISRGEPDLDRARYARRRAWRASPAASPAQAGGLYLIHVLGAVTVEQVKLACPPSTLVFSPDARFAVGEGDEHTAASLFDSRNARCRQVHPDGPIRVLGWAPGSAAFLYSTPGGTRAQRGRFPLYHRRAQRPILIAVSSSAAAYTGSGHRDGARQSRPESADRGGVARQAGDRANRELHSQAGQDDRRYARNTDHAGDDAGEHDGLLARFRRAGAAIVRGRGRPVRRAKSSPSRSSTARHSCWRAARCAVWR